MVFVSACSGWLLILSLPQLPAGRLLAVSQKLLSLTKGGVLCGRVRYEIGV